MCVQLWQWPDIFFLIVQSSFVIGVTFVVLDRGLYGIGMGSRYVLEKIRTESLAGRRNERVILSEKKV